MYNILYIFLYFIVRYCDKKQRKTMESSIFLKKVGQRVRSIRKSKGMSQFEFSILCEIERPYLVRIEQGSGNITLKTLIKIANSLEMEPYELIRVT